jgi:hypothetical protein
MWALAVLLLIVAWFGDPTLGLVLCLLFLVLLGVTER